MNTRNNVVLKGNGTKPMLFVHGFGCDQNMWRFVAPAFEATHKIVLLDLVGSGQSEFTAYDRQKYSTLDGHASDILEICDELSLQDAVLVGHSVSSMIVTLAANRDPDRFSDLVLVAPSPSYINDGDYVGGFSRADIDELIEMLDANYLGWSRQMAPAIMGVPDRPDLGDELTNSFCRTDPEIARHFARVTFLSDHREDAKQCLLRSLILQCSKDIVAPVEVGQWLDRNMQDSRLVLLDATGHCPHMSAPEETIAAIRQFLN